MAIYGVEKHDSYGTRRAEISPCQDSEYDLLIRVFEPYAPGYDTEFNIDKIDIESILSKLRHNQTPNCAAICQRGPMHENSDYEEHAIIKNLSIQYGEISERFDVIFLWGLNNELHYCTFVIQIDPISKEITSAYWTTNRTILRGEE